jgi:O-antigen/teichoic acid export membrane protein
MNGSARQPPSISAASRCETRQVTAGAVATRFRQLAGSSYLRGILTLSGGQMAAALIPFMAAPVLGRVYLPEDYALLATYVAVVNLATSFVTLQYQHGILIEKTTRRAHQVAWVSLAATAGVAALMIPVGLGIFLLDPFAAASGGHQMWFAALPLSILVAGTSFAAMAVANRSRAYKTLAAMQFSSPAASAIASIAFGLLSFRAEGLMLATMLGQAITFGFSTFVLLRHNVLQQRSSIRNLTRIAARHRGFPLFTLPAAFMQTMGAQLPVMVLTFMGAAGTLGSFSRAQQLLILPVSMFSSAVGRVYFQRAAEDYNRTGSCREILLKTIPLLSVIAIPFLLAFTLLGESIFAFYLGENWREAGKISRIICPVLFLQMFVSPLGSSILFAGNQRVSLYLQTFGLALALVGCLIPQGLHAEPYQVLLGWALALSALGILQIYIGWKLAKQTTRKM